MQLPGVVKGEARFELMRDADVFVFPTYYPIEGQPTVLLEAMRWSADSDHRSGREPATPSWTVRPATWCRSATPR